MSAHRKRALVRFMAGASAVAFAAPGVAAAQQAADPTQPTQEERPSTATTSQAEGSDSGNTVVVTGIRASLQESREIKKNAVGVVAAVNGQILWADIFSSPQLLERYWAKLVRSYAAEAMITRAAYSKADVGSAQEFVNSLGGKREVSETEPGVFRQTEVTGDGYRVFELTSLLPKMGFEVHIAKMMQ